MGDRYDRDMMARRRRHEGLKFPEPILRWGLGSAVAGVGHNGGPPLDEEPGYLVRRYCWKKAHREAWKTPPMPILKFRVARAEAAGVSYEAYMSELLDTGRRLQIEDVDPTTGRRKGR